MADLTCGVCGVEGDEGAIRPGMTSWAVRPAGHDAWESIQRCVDHDACRGRVRAAGRVWPLIEGKTNPAEVIAGWRATTGDADRRKREYAEFVRTHPGMTDPRPPVLDPATGNFRFQPPKPLEPIPTVEPTGRAIEQAWAPAVAVVVAAADPEPDDPKEWW